MKLPVINTARLSENYRAKAIDVPGRRILVTRFPGSKQADDLSEPPNCNGVGRVRHFRRQTSTGWPRNPLPIDPACDALGIESPDMMQAQVFQNAVCNWRCWYCFVDFELLSANRHHSEWKSADELVDLYAAYLSPPRIIDVTGGQPDLTPEWVIWMLDALECRNLQDSVYLWSDDNLSNDYFWRYVSETDRNRLAACRTYGRVCCFKGINEASFAFNTLADPTLFDQQLLLFERFVQSGIDVYGYVTLTTPSLANVGDDIARFMDRLQQIHRLLPLRVIPLEIAIFSPVVGRMNPEKNTALQNQQVAIEYWVNELHQRFTEPERSRAIHEIDIRGQL